MSSKPGVLLTSLDFELYWGIRDLVTVDQVRQQLLGARRALPQIVELFETYGVHATFATVGFLFAKTRQELQSNLPRILPRYRNMNLSAYPHLPEVGEDETADPFHFGGSLIDLIQRSPGQEIGSHTLSHYYCLEEGADDASFREDLLAAQEVARRRGITLRSLVFPRNQYGPGSIRQVAAAGLLAFRGNPTQHFYKPARFNEAWGLTRGFRLLDAYLDLSGSGAYCPQSVATADGPVNLPASRFLRPYSPCLRPLEGLRFRRIARSLRKAAREGLIYHLWWHPYNFGTYTQENMVFLERILRLYRELRKEYGIRSLNMGELAVELKTESQV